MCVRFLVGLALNWISFKVAVDKQHCKLKIAWLSMNLNLLRRVFGDCIRLHKIEEITKLQNSSNNTKKSVRLRKHAYTQTFMQLNGIYIADVDL